MSLATTWSIPTRPLKNPTDARTRGADLTPKGETSRRAEETVARILRGEGFRVTDLNEVAGNFPLADLGALRGEERILIQVRGTVAAHGDFPAPPAKARKLHAFAEAVGCRGLYALAHFTGDSEVIRFDTATRVAELGEAMEESWGRKTYLHVNIEDFEVTAGRISDLLQ